MANLGDFSIDVELLFDEAQLKRKMAEIEQQVKGKMRVDLDTTQAQRGVKELTAAQVQADQQRTASGRAAAAEEAQRLRDHRATMQLNIRLQAEASRAERERSKASIDALANEQAAYRNMWQARQRSDEEAYADQSRIKQQALEMAATLDKQSDAYRRLTQVAASAQRSMDAASGVNTPGGFSAGVTQGILNALGNLGAVGQILEQVISVGMKAAQKDAADGARDVAKEAGEGLKAGLKAQATGVSKAAGDLGETVEDGAKKALDIHSPSRVMYQVGENAAEGLAQGILAKANTAQLAGQKLAQAARDGVGDLRLDVSGTVNLPAGATNTMSTIAPEIAGEAMGEVVEKITEAVAAFKELPKAAEDAGDAVESATEGMGESVGGAVEQSKALRDAHREQDEAARGAALGELKTAAALAATTAVITGVVVGITSSVNAYADFEKAMNAVKAVAGDMASGEFEALKQQALDLGASTKYAATDIAGVQEELLKAGVKIKDVLGGAAEGVTLLASATGTELSTAADISAKVANMFGVSGDKMSRVADVLTNAANSTALDVDTLGSALQQVGGIANASGLSLQETAAVLGVLADKGMEGSDAGTSLKTMLQRLKAPTDETTAALEKYNIKVFDSTGKQRDMIAVLAEVLAAMDKMTDEQRAAFGATVAGDDAVRALTTAYQTGIGPLKDYIEKMDKHGSAAEQSKIRMDGLRGAQEKLGGAMDTFKTKVGSVFTPAVTEIVDAAANGIDKLSELFDWLQRLQDERSRVQKTALEKLVDEKQQALNALETQIRERRKFRDQQKAMGRDLTPQMAARLAQDEANAAKLRAELNQLRTDLKREQQQADLDARTRAINNPNAAGPHQNGQGTNLKELAGLLGVGRYAVTQEFGSNPGKHGYGARGHQGVDVATPVGTAINAAFEGTLYTGFEKNGYGRYVKIIDEKGQAIILAHLSRLDKALEDEIKLYGNAKVKAGQLIAYSGNTGNSTGPHLHMEGRTAGNMAVDPRTLAYVGTGSRSERLGGVPTSKETGASADEKAPKAFSAYIKEAERILGQVKKYAADGTAPNADKWRKASDALKAFTKDNDLAAQAVQWVQSKAKEAGKEVSKYGQTFDRLSRQMDIAGNAEKLGTNVVPQLKAIQAEAEKAAAAELKRNGQSEKYVKLQGIAADAAAKLKTIEDRASQESETAAKQRAALTRDITKAAAQGRIEAAQRGLKELKRLQAAELTAAGDNAQKRAEIVKRTGPAIIEAEKLIARRTREAAVKEAAQWAAEQNKIPGVDKAAVEKERVRRVQAAYAAERDALIAARADQAQAQAGADKQARDAAKANAATRLQNQRELNDALARNDEQTARNRLQRLKDQQAEELAQAGDDAKKKAAVIKASGPAILKAEADINALVRKQAEAKANQKANDARSKPGADKAAIARTLQADLQAAAAAEKEANRRAQAEQSRAEQSASQTAREAAKRRAKEQADLRAKLADTRRQMDEQEARDTLARIQELNRQELAAFKGTAQQRLALITRQAKDEYDAAMKLAEVQKKNAYTKADNGPAQLRDGAKKAADRAYEQARLQAEGKQKDALREGQKAQQQYQNDLLTAANAAQQELRQLTLDGLNTRLGAEQDARDRELKAAEGDAGKLLEIEQRTGASILALRREIAQKTLAAGKRAAEEANRQAKVSNATKYAGDPAALAAANADADQIMRGKVSNLYTTYYADLGKFQNEATGRIEAATKAVTDAENKSASELLDTRAQTVKAITDSAEALFGSGNTYETQAQGRAAGIDLMTSAMRELLGVTADQVSVEQLANLSDNIDALVAAGVDLDGVDYDGLLDLSRTLAAFRTQDSEFLPVTEAKAFADQMERIGVSAGDVAEMLDPGKTRGKNRDLFAEGQFAAQDRSEGASERMMGVLSELDKQDLSQNPALKALAEKLRTTLKAITDTGLEDAFQSAMQQLNFDLSDLERGKGSMDPGVYAQMRRDVLTQIENDQWEHDRALMENEGKTAAQIETARQAHRRRLQGLEDDAHAAQDAAAREQADKLLAREREGQDSAARIAQGSLDSRKRLGMVSELQAVEEAGALRLKALRQQYERETYDARGNLNKQAQLYTEYNASRIAAEADTAEELRRIRLQVARQTEDEVTRLEQIALDRRHDLGMNEEQYLGERAAAQVAAAQRAYDRAVQDATHVSADGQTAVIDQDTIDRAQAQLTASTLEAEAQRDAAVARLRLQNARALLDAQAALEQAGLEERHALGLLSERQYQADKEQADINAAYDRNARAVQDANGDAEAIAAANTQLETDLTQIRARGAADRRSIAEKEADFEVAQARRRYDRSYGLNGQPELVAALQSKYDGIADALNNPALVAGSEEYNRLLTQLLDTEEQLADAKALPNTLGTWSAALDKLGQDFASRRITAEEFTEKLKDLKPRLLELADAAEKAGDAKTAQGFRDMANSLNAMTPAIAAVLQKMGKVQEYIGYFKDLAGAFGKLTAAIGETEEEYDSITGEKLATPWKDLTANLDGAAKAAETLMSIATDVMKVIANPADIGAWVSLITKVVSSIADAIAGFQKAKAEAKKLRDDFAEQNPLLNAGDYQKVSIRSRGFFADLFGGGPQVVNEIDKIGLHFAQTMQSALQDGLRNGLKEAIKQNDMSVFSRYLKEGVGDAILSGVVDSFIQGELLKNVLAPAIKAWSDAMKTTDNGADDLAALAQLDTAVSTSMALGGQFFQQVVPRLDPMRQKGYFGDPNTPAAGGSLFGAAPGAQLGVARIEATLSPDALRPIGDLAATLPALTDALNKLQATATSAGSPEFVAAAPVWARAVDKFEVLIERQLNALPTVVPQLALPPETLQGFGQLAVAGPLLVQGSGELRQAVTEWREFMRGSNTLRSSSNGGLA